MRNYPEIAASASFFFNDTATTEIYTWMENWCYRCHNPVELAWRRYETGERKTAPKDFPGGCPLILAAMNGLTPSEWLEQDRFRLGDQYHCIEYRGPDEGGGEPRPRPEPRDMDGLFPRPERRMRLLKQPDVLEVANA